MLERLRARLFFAIASILMLASCGDVYDLNGFDYEPEVPMSDTLFNRDILVLNLGDNLPEGHKPLDANDPLYFSLEKLNTANILYKTTDRWDIALSGQGRSSITANNGKASGLGYGSSAVGGLYLAEAAYSTVQDVPEDQVFATPGYSGLDAIGEFGNGVGHVAYTFFGNMFRPDKVVGYMDTSYPLDVQMEAANYAHMLYALSERMAQDFPASLYTGVKTMPRTIFIRTAKGNYAKVEMLSYYRNTIDPVEMNRGRGLAVSFRYMMVKANEIRFGFVARRNPMTMNFSTGKITVDTNPQ